MKVQEFFNTLKGSNYLKFIEVCRKKQYSGKTEIHHVYPRSLEDGKIQESWNLVRVSKADHLLAHILLFEDFEKLDRPKGKSYYSVLGSVHTAFKTRYENLPVADREVLKSQVVSLDSIWQKVQGEWQRSAQEARARKWNGNCMGACFTKEANLKRQNTKIAKYGHGNGRMGDRDVIEKGIATRKQRYCGDAMGQCRTKEALKKQEQTMLQRYGRRYMITDPEVKAHNRQVLREKYGTCTGAMNNPESREKAKKSHQVTINRKKTVVRTEEFKQWYQGKEITYNHRPHAGVQDFLNTVGKKLEDYLEFIG